MLDAIFSAAFSSAYTAIFEVGSVMAILMLVFGALDFRYGDKIRDLITRKKLDRPELMLGMSFIPVDGTLLFQYATYRRGSIRLGSLLAGIIGIGEEATYLILTYQPVLWLWIVFYKAVAALLSGYGLNRLSRGKTWLSKLHAADEKAGIDTAALEADENFHELPDKFRHKLHHFRYHALGRYFWIFFAVALLIQLSLGIQARIGNESILELKVLHNPLVYWLAMAGLVIILIYRIIIRMTTREFGKIFEHEFEDTGDAVGDLAETCSGVITLIFLLTFAIEGFMLIVGPDRLAQLFHGRGILAVFIGALVGLIPGTGASMAFTTLYFVLSGTDGAMPFAALLACSMSLIGDSQLIGNKQIKISQRLLHLISCGLAMLTGLMAYALNQFFGFGPV